jgi:hypothetical protein
MVAKPEYSVSSTWLLHLEFNLPGYLLATCSVDKMQQQMALTSHGTRRCRTRAGAEASKQPRLDNNLPELSKDMSEPGTIHQRQPIRRYRS